MGNFYTRPNFEDRQHVQYSGTSITLSGETNINNLGSLQINAPILDFTGTTTASTVYTVAGVQGYVNYGQPSSFIVEPPIILLSGSTGTTTVDVTGYFLGGLDSTGKVTWIQAPPSGSSSSTVFSGGSGNCITDLYITNLHGCSPITVWDSIQSSGSTASGYLSFAFGVHTIASGLTSHAQGFHTTASGEHSHAGGYYSTTSGNTSFVHSENSTVNSHKSSILGGSNNSINGGINSVILGGNGNSATPGVSTILGGQANTIDNSFNVSNAFSQLNSIINGESNTISSAFKSVIIGGAGNSLQYDAIYSATCGNSGIFVGTGNMINGHSSSVILGGNDNIINFNAISSNAILGGELGLINGVGYSTVLGGFENKIYGQKTLTGSSFTCDAIVGGSTNKIYSGNSSVIIGGSNNQLNDTYYSVIVGGQNITGLTSNTVYVPNITVQSGKKIHGQNESKATIGFGTLGSEYIAITQDNEGYVKPYLFLDSTIGDLGTSGGYDGAFIGFTVAGTGNTSYNTTGVRVSNNTNNNVNSTDNNNVGVFIGARGSTFLSGVKNSVIIGGINITASTNNTTYVDNLNIKTIGVGTSVNNLGVDVNGNVVVGTAGGGISIDPYEIVPSTTSLTWDVSGTSTNYEMTLTGNTTLTLTNVRNGDYGTLILTQGGVGGYTLTFGAGTHRVVNGGGGSPTLTSTVGAIDILSFTHNATTFFWTVGNDYT